MSNSNVLQTSSMPTSPDSSKSSESSEATEPDTSSSEQIPPSTSTPPSSSALKGIQYQERIFIVGATSSGKSHLAREMFLSIPSRKLVIDPSDSTLTAQAVGDTKEEIAEATFRDPTRVPDNHAVRFVPTDPADMDAYDALYRWAFSSYPLYVWLDEAGIAAPANGYPRWLNTYVVQGRKRMLGHLACHTRPREVCRNLIAQAAHVFIFSLPNPDDRRHVADIAGLPVSRLEAVLGSLPEHGFAWWNLRTQQLVECAPL